MNPSLVNVADPDIDHLVYATPDLETTIADLEASLGVRAAYGDRHPGRGTRNALIALSDFSYLEIVGPDPTQRDVSGPCWCGIEALTASRLVTWAAKGTNIEHLVAEACRARRDIGTGSCRITADDGKRPPNV